jgi:DNA-binding response OmpR family regulator
MASDTRSGGTVLIVDTDPGIRRLITAVLEHAGFRTVVVDDVQSAAAKLKTSTFSVIVRDLNLAPAERRRTLQQLAATAPELLRRTVVMTTAPSRAETALAAGTVFAIVSKPFDLETLLNAVRECARASREADRRAATRTASSRQSEGDKAASLKLDPLQRFAMSVPSLQHLLSDPVGGQREAALRAEMRRTLGTLADTLTEAAHVEGGGTRAAVLRAASTVATRLATVPAHLSAVAPYGRDH